MRRGTTRDGRAGVLLAVRAVGGRAVRHGRRAAALVAVLPRDGEGSSAGLAAGIAFGLLAAAVWCAGAACGVW